MERWTDVVAAVHNEIELARAQAQAQRLPWVDPRRPLSPRQVRRMLARIIAQEGTLVAPPLRKTPRSGLRGHRTPRPAPSGHPQRVSATSQTASHGLTRRASPSIPTLTCPSCGRRLHCCTLA